jgi:hypothetical protein
VTRLVGGDLFAPGFLSSGMDGWITAMKNTTPVSNPFVSNKWQTAQGHSSPEKRQWQISSFFGKSNLIFIDSEKLNQFLNSSL